MKPSKPFRNLLLAALTIAVAVWAALRAYIYVTQL